MHLAHFTSFPLGIVTVLRFIFLAGLTGFVSAADPVASTPGAALAPGSATIAFTVSGLANDRGGVRVALYSASQANQFPMAEEAAQDRQRVVISNRQAGGRFTNVTPGTYAIALFHDVDDDGKLGTNWLGIPKEPIGASRDAKGTMGPPSFADAKFEVAAGATVELTIKVE
jgi:uncharacterized protein (DUF2141 family)